MFIQTNFVLKSSSLWTDSSQMFRLISFFFSTIMLTRAETSSNNNPAFPERVDINMRTKEGLFGQCSCQCQMIDGPKIIDETASVCISGMQTVAAITSAEHPLSLKGYVHFPGVGSYKLYPGPSTFAAAEQTCHKDGAILAYPNSDKEMEVLEKIFDQHPELYDFAYLGFKKGPGGDFLTLKDQKPLNESGFEKWYPGEPNNLGGRENCGTMHRSGYFNDRCCGIPYTRLPFFCECDIS